MQKIATELIGTKQKYNELIDRKIIVKSSNSNEYLWLFNTTYQFAISEHPESEVILPTIGNIMRRLLEAFFTFNYRKAFYEYVFTDEFLNVLPENKRTYYGNLMTRLVLNGSSHEEEAVRTLSDLFALFTPEEMKITAKSILSMIYLLNNLHVRQYLGDSAIIKMEEWQAERFDEVNG